MDLWNGVGGAPGCGEDLRSETSPELAPDRPVRADF